MAAEAFKILGTIVVDASKAEQTISKTAGHAESASTRIANAFKKIGTAIVTHLALNRIADFGKECLELAASVQAVESQFSQVFSDSAFGSLEKEATASLKSISKEAGIATNRLKGSFVKIASFAKTTGMDTAEALNLTERAMIAAADSSAFLDRSIEDTTATLMSFLKGNYENDAALNLSCTEITRNAAANALYGKSFIELSEAQKQLTLLQMVEDANRLSGAMGQAAREADTWTNQVGNLKQAWSDFKATIGGLFLDKAVGVVKRLSEFLVEATDKIPKINQLLQSFVMKLGIELPDWGELKKNISDGWLIGVWPYIQGFFTKAFEIAMPIWDDITEMISTGWEDTIWPVVQKIFKTTFNVELPDWGYITSLIGDAWSTAMWPAIQEWFQKSFDIILPDWSAITDAIKEGWKKVKEEVGEMVMDAAINISTNHSVTTTYHTQVKQAASSVGSAVEKATGSGFLNSLSQMLVNNSTKNPDAPWLPGFKSGLDYVPEDDFVARLHKGEAVLTKEEASEWRSGGNHELASAIRELTDSMPGMIADALSSVRIDVNKREFGRLVKAVT